VIVDGPPEPTDSRTNLPAARVVLYGRAAEIEQLAGEVLSAPGRLVTITGSGGVGKTSSPWPWRVRSYRTCITVRGSSICPH
jgi:hypothetical protein